MSEAQAEAPDRTPPREGAGVGVGARALPSWLGRPGPTAWHRLDPLTRLTVSAATVGAAVVLGGVAGPLLLGTLAVGLPATIARVWRDLLRLTLLPALPLAVSAALVNLLSSPTAGAPVAQVGPLTVTDAGIRIALEVTVRAFVMAGAVALFYLTTRPAELVASLQAHGASGRLTFVIHSAVATLPRLAERASEVTAAQRARGLDSEGGLRRRSRGVLAMVAPTVLGAIGEAETRSLALETRGFARPGRRTLLWAPADTGAQRLARWAIALMLAGLVILRLTGWTTP